jgi:predicted DNA-binding transcriptional regulator YafY
MRRTERLFQIIQILRARRGPTTGEALAQELTVSLRTLYRDIAELIAQRVPIRGEAGIGYVIDSDFDMPPLMLTADELEAAALGAAWVAQRGDEALVRGARDLIAKLTAAVPEHLRPVILDANLRAISRSGIAADSFDVGTVRQAIRTHRKLDIAYRNEQGEASRRRIWPIAMAYSEQHRLVAAWCELRSDFRHFRTDRVGSCELLNDAIPVPVQKLRKQWEKARVTRNSSSKRHS